MACVFAVKVQSWLNITRVAVQTFEVIEKLSRYCYFLNSTGPANVGVQFVSEPEIGQGAEV